MTLKMGAAYPLETALTVYQTTWSRIPEESNFHGPFFLSHSRQILLELPCVESLNAECTIDRLTMFRFSTLPSLASPLPAGRP